MIKVTTLWVLVAMVLINKSVAQNCQQVGCDPGFCCSKWGYCGSTPLHCSGGGQPNNSYNGICQPSCGPGLCCSRWGFCGDTPLHCSGNGQISNTDGGICQPPCGPGVCCSKWGFCGTTPLHCSGGGQTNNSYNGICQPSCGLGLCCSRWGFCGDTPLHCSGGGQIGNTDSGICQPPCGPGVCCSKWGFCGTTPLHCSGGSQTNSSYSGMCQPSCGPGLCCSRWGFCGNSPLHCAGGQTNDTYGNTCQPPCGPGVCCSKWGFCGNSPLHCTGSGTTTTPSVTVSSPTTVSPPVDSGQCSPGCPQGLCCSKWGYCGSTPEYCDGQSANSNSDNATTISRARFDCIFDQLDPALRDKRWQGYQDALSMIPFDPQNQDELIMFFAHVSHETDGLKTYEEYCGQSGQCANDYQNSWCSPVQAEPGKQYYGRGWFQLSWPCNYDGAGNALGVDLLKNPEQVADSDALAAATAIWFWNTNNMGQPARDGNFGGTTQKINSIECGATPQQDNRISRYQKVRRCFGLADATDNLRC